MPGSNSTYSGGGVAGLNLQGWAQINTTTGALIQGSAGIATARSAVGAYTVTLPVALPTQNAIVIVRGNPTSVVVAASVLHGRMSSTTVCDVGTNHAGAPADGQSLHVEIYR